MKHYLYVGHFVHDGDFLRLVKRAEDGVLVPVAFNPLPIGILRNVFCELSGQSEYTIPAEWGVLFENGYLVCDQYTHEPKAISFVVEVANRAKCEVYQDLRWKLNVEEIKYLGPRSQIS